MFLGIEGYSTEPSMLRLKLQNKIEEMNSTFPFYGLSPIYRYVNLAWTP